MTFDKIYKTANIGPVTVTSDSALTIDRLNEVYKNMMDYAYDPYAFRTRRKLSIVQLVLGVKRYRSDLERLVKYG